MFEVYFPFVQRCVLGSDRVHTGPQQCIPQTPQAFNMVANLNVILGGYDGVYGSIILGGCSERTLQTIQGYMITEVC